jgi:hypothetical protein
VHNTIRKPTPTGTWFTRLTKAMGMGPVIHVGQLESADMVKITIKRNKQGGKCAIVSLWKAEHGLIDRVGHALT